MVVKGVLAKRAKYVAASIGAEKLIKMHCNCNIRRQTASNGP